jgi:DNA-binding NarL/FixJ family response regulator
MIDQEQRRPNCAVPQPFSRDAEILPALTPYESLLTWLVLTLLGTPSVMPPTRAVPVVEIHSGLGSSPSAVGRLTAREAEVLHLVTMGLTNSEIASHLFVSRRTIDHHLTSIYNRLGVTSRAAATRFAVLHNLC